MKIKDESKDKKYFTIIPNFILNSSTAIDQALYMQIKRIAGDDGECSASLSYFQKQLGAGRDTIYKSINYLIKHKWISFVGKKKNQTYGGKQKINTYTVNDIWNLNNNYYNQGSPNQNHPKIKGSPETASKVVLKPMKGSPNQDAKKNYKNIYIKKKMQSNDCGQQINILLKEYESINPTINYGNKTQRKVLKDMLKQFGYEKLLNTIKYAVNVQGQKYAPTITTPYQLKTKLGDLMVFYKKEINKSSKFGSI